MAATRPNHHHRRRADIVADGETREAALIDSVIGKASTWPVHHMLATSTAAAASAAGTTAAAEAEAEAAAGCPWLPPAFNSSQRVAQVINFNDHVSH
jgi:hypothetical protein